MVSRGVKAASASVAAGSSASGPQRRNESRGQAVGRRELSERRGPRRGVRAVTRKVQAVCCGASKEHRRDQQKILLCTRGQLLAAFPHLPDREAVDLSLSDTEPVSDYREAKQAPRPKYMPSKLALGPQIGRKKGKEDERRAGRSGRWSCNLTRLRVQIHYKPH